MIDLKLALYNFPHYLNTGDLELIDRRRIFWNYGFEEGIRPARHFFYPAELAVRLPFLHHVTKSEYANIQPKPNP